MRRFIVLIALEVCVAVPIYPNAYTKLDEIGLALAIQDL